MGVMMGTCVPVEGDYPARRDGVLDLVFILLVGGRSTCGGIPAGQGSLWSFLLAGKSTWPILLLQHNRF